MKAKRFKFRTILEITFECEECGMIHNITQDVTNARNETVEFSMECIKCKHLNRVTR